MTWVAYDTVTGDVLADGPEGLVRRYAAQCDGTVAVVSEADWRRVARRIGRRMSGNPPRRNPAAIEHL